MMAAFYVLETTGSVMFALFGLAMLIDAGIGCHVLRQIYSSNGDKVEILDGLLNEEEKEPR